MPLTYFVIDNPKGGFHIVYQIPGTKTFRSVATSMSESLAQAFAAQLNGRAVLLDHDHEKGTPEG